MDARRLLDEIRTDLRATEEEIRTHPFVAAVEAGTAPIEALCAFAGHQHHIVISDLRSIACLVQRFGHTAARPFLMGVLEGERVALDRLAVLARRVGMSEADLEAFEPTAKGFAYGTYMAWQALYGSAAEFVSGILLNFPIWGSNCGRLSRGLRTHYGLGPEETAFLDGFAEMPSFEEPALAIIQDGLDHGVGPLAVHRAARLFQAYEKMFWDALATPAPERPAASG
ncbi:MAG: transcriptional regulator [Gemmatimonadota bacterium]